MCRSAAPRRTLPCTSPGSACASRFAGAVGNDPFGLAGPDSARRRRRRRQRPRGRRQLGPPASTPRILSRAAPSPYYYRNGSAASALDRAPAGCVRRRRARARDRHPRLARSGLPGARRVAGRRPATGVVRRQLTGRRCGRTARPRRVLRELATRADDGIRRPRRGGRPCGVLRRRRVARRCSPTSSSWSRTPDVRRRRSTTAGGSTSRPSTSWWSSRSARATLSPPATSRRAGRRRPRSALRTGHAVASTALVATTTTA